MPFLIGIGVFFAVVLLILTVLIFSQISVFADTRGGYNKVYLKILWFKFDIIPIKTRTKKQAVKKKVKKETSSRKIDTIKTLNLFLDNFDGIKLILKSLFRRLHINHLFADIIIANENPATAATIYGTFAAVVGVAAPFINIGEKAKNTEINVNLDFDSSKCRFCIYSAVSIRIVYILTAIIRLYAVYKKIKKAGRCNENERTSNRKYYGTNNAETA